MTVLESHYRELTVAERRVLQSNIRRAKLKSRRAARPYSSIGIFVTLWLLSVVAGAPTIVVTMFWVIAGGAITLWAKRGAVKHHQALLGRLESALRWNTAEVYDVRARSFAEFEEIEDEGACYAFDLGDGRMVFILGQELYPGARFPSLGSLEQKKL